MININFKKSVLALAILATSFSGFSQEGTVSVDQPAKISKLLEYKKDLSTVDAYIIQVYNGPRKGAEKTKSDVAGQFPEWSNSIEYEQPNYKIWVGNFRTRLEADRALIIVKKNYNNAFILRPRKSK